MSDDAPLKSAFELAMERLRAEDRERGAPQARPLTAEQKSQIAELRAKAKAKLAELEILHRKEMAAARAVSASAPCATITRSPAGSALATAIDATSRSVLRRCATR